MKPDTLIDRFLRAACAATLTLMPCVLDGAPDEKSKDGAASSKAPAALQLGILAEYYSLDHGELTRLLEQHAGSADATPLRTELAKMTDKDTAERVETLWLPARSGQRAKVESIQEIIYPTEYDPPEIPEKLALEKIQVEKYRGTPANPTAYETRNAGATIEVDPVVGKDGKTIDINFVPERVEFLGKDYHQREGVREDEHSSMWMPMFYTMKVTSAVTTRDGEWFLAGVFTPAERGSQRVVLVMRVSILK